MAEIALSTYLKREPNTVPFFNDEEINTEENNRFLSDFIKVFENDNEINNTGSQCHLLNSEHLELIT